MLVAPATFFQNRYLKDVRGYSATLIALFTLVTNTPGAIGIMVGGRLADVRGRRLVGTIALLAVAVGTVVVFSVAGDRLWLAKTVAAIFGGAMPCPPSGSTPPSSSPPSGGAAPTA